MPLTPAQFDTLERVTDRVRGMLHQFAAGIYPDEAPLEAGALQDLMSVVRAHSALHDDAHAGSALHLVQIDASLDEELLEPSTVEIVEPAAAIPDDVEAAAQEPAPQETVTAEPVDEGDATFTERRAVARRRCGRRSE